VYHSKELTTENVSNWYFALACCSTNCWHKFYVTKASVFINNRISQFEADSM